MTSGKALGTYLNDHLAGATAAAELVERARSDDGGELSGFLRELAGEIQEDRETLEELRAALGGERDPVREAAGWMAEKLSRLRLKSAGQGSSELSLLLQVETLWMGIQGKLAMWEALASLENGHPALEDVDIERLIKRARQQLHDLNEHRLELAARVLGES